LNFQGLESTERFEHLCKLLLLKEYPSLQTIDGRAGDQGKDSFVGIFDKAIQTFQVKYFERIGPSQRKQMEDSLSKASEQKPNKWTLLLSVEFNKHDWAWFENLRSKYPNIELDVWQKTRVESLVLDPKNEGLKDIFPELFPISTIVDRSVAKTLEGIGITTRQMATSLIDQITGGNLSKEQLVELLRESRTKQYSTEIRAAENIIERFNDEERAAQTLREVYDKAAAEGDKQNEMSAIYGLLTLLGKVPQPDLRLLALADRGIELARTLGTKDALALIESQKATMLQSLALTRYRQLQVHSLVLKTTGNLAIAIPYLRQAELGLHKLAEEVRTTAISASAHAFESKDFRVIGTVMMLIGFSIGIAAFQYKTFGEDTKVYSESAEMLLNRARAIFAEMSDDGLLAYAENNLAVYWWSMRNKEKSESHAKVALALAKNSSNKFIETRMLETLEQLRTGTIPLSNEVKVDYTPDVQEKMLRFLIRDMGFDIETPKSEADEAVKIGVKDLNP